MNSEFELDEDTEVKDIPDELLIPMDDVYREIMGDRMVASDSLEEYAEWENSFYNKVNITGLLLEECRKKNVDLICIRCSSVLVKESKNFPFSSLSSVFTRNKFRKESTFPVVWDMDNVEDFEGLKKMVGNAHQVQVHHSVTLIIGVAVYKNKQWFLLKD